jgi:hypothetical protein
MLKTVRSRFMPPGPQRRRRRRWRRWRRLVLVERKTARVIQMRGRRPTTAVYPVRRNLCAPLAPRPQSPVEPPRCARLRPHRAARRPCMSGRRWSSACSLLPRRLLRFDVRLCGLLYQKLESRLERLREERLRERPRRVEAIVCLVEKGEVGCRG